MAIDAPASRGKGNINHVRAGLPHRVLAYRAPGGNAQKALIGIAPMFYSRPQLPQLGLDLVEVDGGLGRPSQYRGRTSDGRPIFLAYDNGWLVVATEDDRNRLGEELLSVQIGPNFNGDMLLEQICDLTGITLRGEKPALSDETWREAAERSWVLDWSGRTTYWVRNLHLSAEGGRHLARELAETFLDMRILEVHWDHGGVESKRRYIPRRSISQCRRSALFGFGADPDKLQAMLARSHVPLAALDEVFAHHVDLQFSWGGDSDQSAIAALGARHGRRLALPEGQLQASIETQFATGDAAGRAFAQRLIEVMQRCFSPWVEEVDLATGEALGAPKQSTWSSFDLRDWCAASPDRFLDFYSFAKRDIGIRACTAPA